MHPFRHATIIIAVIHQAPLPFSKEQFVFVVGTIFIIADRFLIFLMPRWQLAEGWDGSPLKRNK